MKYIDADKLKVEAKRHIKELKEAENRLRPNLGFFDAKLSGIYDMLSIIDSLQQEQPEVDLEKELDRYLRGEFQQTAGGNFNNYIQVARHFYELGLNARKEESK